MGSNPTLSGFVPGTVRPAPNAPVTRVMAVAWRDLSRPEQIAFWVAWAWLLGSMIHFSRFTYDDVFISLRYAENLMEGRGYTFNPGERVEGASNPLWVWLLGACAWMRLPILPTAKVVGGLAVLGVPWLQLGLSRALAPWRPNVVSVWLTALAAPMAFWGVNGLETGAEAGLLLLAIVLTHRDLGRTGRIGVSAAPAWLGLALIRPEGAGFTVPYLAVIGIAEFRRWRHGWGTLGSAIIVLGGIAALQAWRWRTFGALVPNTYWAKVANPALFATGNGRGYLWRFLLEWGGPLLPLGAAMGAGLSWRRGRDLSALCSATVLCQVGFILLVSCDWMAGWRFMVPVWPVLALLAGSGCTALWDRVRPEGRGWRTVLVMVLAVGLAGTSARRMSRLDSAIGPNGYGPTGLHRDIGRWLKASFGSGTTLALSDAGEIPYESGLVTMDLLGLTDSYIARHSPAEGAASVLLRAPDLIILAQGTRPKLVLGGGGGVTAPLRPDDFTDVDVPRGALERALYLAPGFSARYRRSRVWTNSMFYDLVLYTRKGFPRQAPAGRADPYHN